MAHAAATPDAGRAVERELIMFGLFRKDPAKTLRAQYARLLEDARDLQRKGDIRGFALKTAEAEEVLKQLDALADGQGQLH
jgi:hypothetical protein